MIVWYLTFLLVLLLCWYWKREKEFWSHIGVPFFAPVPILGNLYRNTFRISSLAEEVKRIYDASEGYKCYGMYSFTDRTLLLRDPELIKQLTIKDFDYFQDHVDTFFKRDPESPFTKSLFALRGSRWRQMRATLSPAFTGRKMRGIFVSMTECGEQFANHFKKELEHSNGTPLDLELKNVFTRLTTDVIATSAFGVKVNSFESADNVFFKMGQAASNFALLRMLAIIFFPSLMRLCNIGIIPAKVTKFFNDLVEESITVREKENINRPDMIQLLMEARKGKTIREKHVDDSVTGFATVEEYLENNEKSNLKLTNSDIAAQAFLFFLGGFDTVSAAMCFTTIELAINVDVQRRLQEEIDEIMAKCNGKLTYDDLNLMKYLDMVVSEGLRKWPPFSVLDRQCVKPYNFNFNGKTIPLEVGQVLSVPVYAIHRDPQHYPNPSKFDPERFNDERKGEINPAAYLPFGSGPRNCVGSRFALMEVKIALVYLFANFNVDVSDKTEIPIVLGVKSFTLGSDKGFWVKLTPRPK